MVEGLGWVGRLVEGNGQIGRGMYSAECESSEFEGFWVDCLFRAEMGRSNKDDLWHSTCSEGVKAPVEFSLRQCDGLGTSRFLPFLSHFPSCHAEIPLKLSLLHVSCPEKLLRSVREK